MADVTIAGYSLSELDPNATSLQNHDQIVAGVKNLSMKLMRAVLETPYGLNELPSLMVDVLNKFVHYNSDPGVPLHGLDYLGERKVYFGGSSKIDYRDGIQIMHDINLEEIAKNSIAKQIFLKDIEIQDALYKEFVEAEK